MIKKNIVNQRAFIKAAPKPIRCTSAVILDWNTKLIYSLKLLGIKSIIDEKIVFIIIFKTMKAPNDPRIYLLGNKCPIEIEVYIKVIFKASCSKPATKNSIPTSISNLPNSE